MKATEIFITLGRYVLFFVPLLVLLAVYWVCRRRNSGEQVEKMKIQDL